MSPPSFIGIIFTVHLRFVSMPLLSEVIILIKKLHFLRLAKYHHTSGGVNYSKGTHGLKS